MIIYKNNPIPEFKKKDDVESSVDTVLDSNISTHKKILKLDKMGYDNAEIFELLNSRNLMSKTMTPSHITAFLKKKKSKK